jgi:hypothetical protein
MVYNSSMLVNLSITLVGVLSFLFILWKRLKEDYASEIIFKTGFNMLLGVWLGHFLALSFFREWFFFSQMAGLIIGLGFSTYFFKVRFYETLEASVLGVLPWLSLFFLGHSVRDASLGSFFGFLATLAIIFAFYYLDTHYKQFVWYRSGRVGFVGLSTLAMIFVARSLVAISGAPMLSFVGKYEGIVSGSIVFICFLLIYNLGRKV